MSTQEKDPGVRIIQKNPRSSFPVEVRKKGFLTERSSLEGRNGVLSRVL